MKLNTKQFKVAAENAARRAVETTDAALIQVGKAAQLRQRRRNATAAFKVAGKAALVVGTAVAAALAIRAVRAKKAAT